MRHHRLLPVVLTLAWALWFGGLITLFLAVTSLFATFAPDRSLAGTAAAGIFRRIEFYQLFLAAVALTASTVMWRTAPAGAAGRRWVLLVLIMLAGAMPVISTLQVSRRIELLRNDRLANTPEFRRLHGISMAL
jgi:hypothetical protein